MDKQENSINSYNHGINLFERKSLVITGVKKIENFDSEQFLLETIMGFMVIKGSELELVKLDTLQGNVSIKGNVSGINYVEENTKKNKEESIFNRLFK
ncbi:MAG: sporulation protein YabP [Bacilli bacterium]|nr:sporulation protein YabP [Mycoplasmatota bacterium]MDD6941170.1 sporulation protein YabP [bacterium]MDY2697191.1 sporulation protein YabP [Bacilli bacterium]MDY5992931.1 sporulation protein YabP [Bacilli bacterium]MEE0014665.1 sporulation protein YabP [Bacilli bacterium]